MSDLPPLPIPYSEGGPPQSHIAPGDSQRELIHEVRNLAQGVILLRRVLSRRSRWAIWAAVAFAVTVVVTLTTFGYLLHEFRTASYDNCLLRNQQQENGARVGGEIAMLVTTLNEIDRRGGLTQDEQDRVAAYQRFLMSLTNSPTEPPVDCTSIRGSF
jgi:hypothetical protein